MVLYYKLLSDRLAFQPVAVSLDVDDPAMVEQSVQDRRGDDLVTEQLLPVDEALVRCDDCGSLLVTRKTRTGRRDGPHWHSPEDNPPHQ